MLVLSRKTNESISIDGGIRITVVSLGRGTVRLGIEAPQNVGILREELTGKTPRLLRRGVYISKNVTRNEPSAASLRMRREAVLRKITENYPKEGVAQMSESEADYLAGEAVHAFFAAP